MITVVNRRLHSLTPDGAAAPTMKRHGDLSPIILRLIDPVGQMCGESSCVRVPRRLAFESPVYVPPAMDFCSQEESKPVRPFDP